jgi:hypothetical protein
MTQQSIDTIKKALDYYHQVNEGIHYWAANDDDADIKQGIIDEIEQAMKEAQELPAMARALRNIAQIEELVECGSDGAPDATEYGYICNQVHGLCHAY